MIPMIRPIDLRKGPGSSLTLVRVAGSDPFNGSLYVFRGKRADRINVILLVGLIGFCLPWQRKESAQFYWPRIRQAGCSSIIPSLWR